MSEMPEQPNEGELILYQTAAGTVRIEVLYESETFWLNQKRIAELLGVEIHTVSYHLKVIYCSGELTPEATLRKIRRVQTDVDPGRAPMGDRQIRMDQMKEVIDECFHRDIFTIEKPKEDSSKALSVSRHFYEYAFTDST
jgi:hypothetical protein